jgi:hypothetical protein
MYLPQGPDILGSWRRGWYPAGEGGKKMNEIQIGGRVFRAGDIITIEKIWVASCEWSPGETLKVEGQITKIGPPGKSGLKTIYFNDPNGRKGRMKSDKFIALNG